MRFGGYVCACAALWSCLVLDAAAAQSPSGKIGIIDPEGAGAQCRDDAAAPAIRDGDRPWADPALSPDERAALLVKAMTCAEKLGLLHSTSINPREPVGHAGLVPGIARLGIPALHETNAELGVAIPLPPGPPDTSDEATALPSGLATAATWNPGIAYANGAMIGREARAKGFNVLLAGDVNLARDPRAGRNFESAGEDPLLAGVMVGAAVHGIEDQHVISTLKHFALNDQETDRTSLDARIDPVALRQSDLLAFEIANERGHPGAVMCAYNRINGAYACENGWLMDRVLRGDWGFRGWLMSDWGAVHSALGAVRAGLDQESGVEWDSETFFGAPLRTAFVEGLLPNVQLDRMARHILRTVVASGLVDDPLPHAPPDLATDARIAERAEEEGIVLLKNEGSLLPLPGEIRSLAVIGGHADIGVLSGGGSSQVIPEGGPALRIDYPPVGGWASFSTIFDPSPPARALAQRLPQARIAYADGSDIDAAASLARHADAAIVFVTKWASEGHDSSDLALPDGQDGLVAAVAAANPRTIVVLETGNPVLMPWRAQVSAILAAWYPGARGGEAIARILVGDVDPSGRLPVTFPASADQLPRPERATNSGTILYGEGDEVGYKWFEARDERPLYPFGFGLSYTSFCHDDFAVSASVRASFTVTNCGSRNGADVAQLYATVPEPDGTLVTRLVGWRKVLLGPGESKRVTIDVDPRLLAHFDGKVERWRIETGTYSFALGTSSRDVAATATVALGTRLLPP
ncbi:MAG TPA: glycoside hydrolase family 3 C-terminal domain-containing protein [Stellaceae bacterium]|nr:glycoside hydrolase family 3 C-terminal domain-containing protein [Stellaceae bacterium]